MRPYGIGNGAQPIVAENMGAGKWERVRQTRNLGCLVSAGIGGIVVVTAVAAPMQIVRLYMGASSLLHSFLLGALFVYLFPAVFGDMSIWYVMFFAELITAIIAAIQLQYSGYIHG